MSSGESSQPLWSRPVLACEWLDDGQFALCPTPGERLVVHAHALDEASKRMPDGEILLLSDCRELDELAELYGSHSGPAKPVYIGDEYTTNRTTIVRHIRVNADSSMLLAMIGALYRKCQASVDEVCTAGMKRDGSVPLWSDPE